MVLGSVDCSSTFNASFIAMVCISRCQGSPSGWPKGSSTAIARGTPYCSAQDGIMVTRMVLRPPSSNIRARTSTSLQQPGQAGVSKTASTPSAFIRSRISGPYLSRHGA